MVDLLVRALSMGKLHHAMMGTAAVAVGTAAAIPGALVSSMTSQATHISSPQPTKSTRKRRRPD
jgi:2-methylaconitate cis-trans-isomerase PrpF